MMENIVSRRPCEKLIRRNRKTDMCLFGEKNNVRIFDMLVAVVVVFAAVAPPSQPNR